nr:Cyclin-dependent kinase 10 [Euglena gracilis]
MEGVAACFPCLPQESKAAIAKDCLRHQNGHANRNASEPSSSFRDVEEYGQEQALRRQHAEKRCFDGSSEPLPLQKRRAPLAAILSLKKQGSFTSGLCREVGDYRKVAKIGEGMYGTVFSAVDKQTNEVVALKKIKTDHRRGDEGFPITAIREIQVLMVHCHKNVVSLKEIALGSSLDSLFLVFEYCEHDLAAVVDGAPKKFAVPEVKCLMQQLLDGVAFLHERFIIHRDLKLSNLLYTSRGQLKICDFGLAREFGIPARPYTPLVVTLWYRPPELLLGDLTYTTGVDMWSVGCIFGELLLMAPLFPGDTEIKQLALICGLLGSPNSRIWPDFASLPHAKDFVLPDNPYSSLRQKIRSLSETGYRLLERLLTYDPTKRIAACDACTHPYFAEHPRALDPDLMPTFPTTHKT